MKTFNLLKNIANARNRLRRSEQKVADYVLAHPNQAIEMRIVDLATQAGVSEPTVVRFCRALGYDGFQQFKLTLAQGLASNREEKFEPFQLNASDTVAEFKQKIFDSMIGNLLQIREQLNADTLEAAIQALIGARRIEVYGYGASAPVCMDAQHKLTRLQMSAAAYADPHMQTISALNLTEQDVVVAISQTGRSKALLHSIQLARNAGATVISICPGQTPLAGLADIPIDTDLDEDKDLSALMSSRVVHLVVIDVLAIGIAMSLGSGLLEHLQTIKTSLQELRESDEAD